mgnify:CR=1 FL=1
MDERAVIPRTEEIYDHVVPILRTFWLVRDREYGSSWCEHGLLSALFNLFRKTDRLSVWLKQLLNGGPTDVPIDTLWDAAEYANAVMAYAAYNRGGEFLVWLKEQAARYPEMVVELQRWEAHLVQRAGDRA